MQANNENLKDILLKSAGQYGIQLDSSQIDSFFKYRDLLIEWNQKFNLTAITEDLDIFIKHFSDSLSVSPQKWADITNTEKSFKAIDIGTGAGFPGIPLKIAFPALKITLVDSLNKRIGFLNEVSRQLELDNIEAIHLRAEEGGKDKNYRERFDLCFSRAVARLNLLSEFCIPFVKTGGIFIAMKGGDCDEEIDEAKPAIMKLGGEIIDIEVITLPFSDIKHTNIVIKKFRQTPSNFPRTYKQMIKFPIN